jgi:hypothetical protein
MKKILLQLVVVGIIFAACDDGSPPPPPPPPPPTTTIPEPPPMPQPKDYVNLLRVDRLVKEYHDFPVTHKCWRDPEYVAIYCPWACADGSDPVFPLTAEEMLAFSEYGRALHDACIDIAHDLPKVNRRCNPDHPQHQPGFCGRSEVRKTREAALRADIEINIALAQELRFIAQQDPVRQICEYDSIKGFCYCRNKYGGAAKKIEGGR